MRAHKFDMEGDVEFNPSPENESASGLIAIKDIDPTVGFGETLRMGSDGKLYQAIGDDSTGVPCIALSIEAGTGNKDVLFRGFIRDDSWSWVLGNGAENLIYLSTDTAGELTQSPSEASGNQIQIVGVVMSSTVIYFNPEYTWVYIG